MLDAFRIHITDCAAPRGAVPPTPSGMVPQVDLGTRDSISLMAEQLEALFDQASSVGICAGGPDGRVGECSRVIVYGRVHPGAVCGGVRKYNESDRPTFGQVGGFRTLELSGPQARRGDQRIDLTRCSDPCNLPY